MVTAVQGIMFQWNWCLGMDRSFNRERSVMMDAYKPNMREKYMILESGSEQNSFFSS